MVVKFSMVSESIFIKSFIGPFMRDDHVHQHIKTVKKIKYRGYLN